MIKDNYAGNGTGTIDFARIKQLNPLLEYCENQGIELRRSGNRWVGKCPLHNELIGEAFVVHPDQKWQCYGKCGRSGDVTDLEQELHGGTVAEAAGRLEGGSVGSDSPPSNVIVVSAAPTLVPTASNPLALPYILTAEEILQCQRYSLRILQDREYLAMIAKAREWQEQTLHDLALDGYLGRDDEGHICFISASGCKSRWRENAERRFRFLFGRSWLWRGELILGAQTVYITEGETDAITLIDTGIEDDGNTAVIGLQGATFNIEPWAFLFASKDVIISTDYDEAGRKAAQNIKQALSGVAKDISYLRLDKEAA